MTREKKRRGCLFTKERKRNEKSSEELGKSNWNKSQLQYNKQRVTFSPFYTRYILFTSFFTKFRNFHRNLRIPRSLCPIFHAC